MKKRSPHRGEWIGNTIKMRLGSYPPKEGMVLRNNGSSQLCVVCAPGVLTDLREPLNSTMSYHSAMQDNNAARKVGEG